MANEFLPDDQGFDTEDAFAALDDPNDPESTLVVEEVLPPFGRGPAFDFAEGHFLIRPSHGPIETRGIDTLRQWVIKCLNTARGAHPVHPDGYGLVRPFDLIGSQFNEFEEADYADRIIDALTFHPRITNVVDFEFDFEENEEALFGTFTVIVDDSDELRISGVALS